MPCEMPREIPYYPPDSTFKTVRYHIVSRGPTLSYILG